MLSLNFRGARVHGVYFEKLEKSPIPKGRRQRTGTARHIAVLISVYLLFLPASALSIDFSGSLTSDVDLNNFPGGEAYQEQLADPRADVVPEGESFSHVFQAGDVNEARQEQLGGGIFSFIKQNGFGNLADIFQSNIGSNDSAAVLFQTGTANSVSIITSGEGNRFLSRQDGFNNMLEADQSGSGHLGVVIQEGEGQRASILQTGFNHIARISQSKNSNIASIIQGGISNEAIIYQRGSGNQADIVQAENG